MTVRSLVVLTLIGCRAAPDAPPAPPSHRPTPVDQPALLAKAERANTEHLMLDYKRPFERAKIADSPAVPLYLDACHGGSKQACWVALQIVAQDIFVEERRTFTRTTTAPARWREVAKLVEANCVEGDHMSCVALPAVDEAFGVTFPNAPGAAGRSQPCIGFEETCPEPAVRRECDAGFPRSCRALAAVLSYQTLDPRKRKLGLHQASDAATNRAKQLSGAACAERIVDGCIFRDYGERRDLDVAAYKTWCELGRICKGVMQTNLERGDTIAARDAAERGCQFFTERCAELGLMYVDGKLPEPIAGRGQRLVDFVCRSVRDTSGEDAMRAYTPCARAKL